MPAASMWRSGTMKFDDLDKRLRLYETAHDHCVLPGIYIVARIDGRGFTKLTKEVHPFEAPYDNRFRDYMVETTAHLMNCGFKVDYGYTQSDEISLLLNLGDETFGRKERKLNSILAGEASAKFSILLGNVASFDCRISQLPTRRDVIDYFRWRNEDAHRNALNAHCYWMLRKNGESVQSATRFLRGKSVADKNELLFQNDINFNDLPTWQKRGIGLLWESIEKGSSNPLTGEKTNSVRKRISINLDLPMKDKYSDFIAGILDLSCS